MKSPCGTNEEMKMKDIIPKATSLRQAQAPAPPSLMSNESDFISASACLHFILTSNK